MTKYDWYDLSKFAPILQSDGTTCRSGPNCLKHNPPARKPKPIKGAPKDYQKAEGDLNSIFKQWDTLIWQGEEVKVVTCAKPKATGGGEGKTDCFLELRSEATGKHFEIKISLKKTNADFVENKISAVRALASFGSEWQEFFTPAITYFDNQLKGVDPIRPDGSLTLGYRLDIINKSSGRMCFAAEFSVAQLEEIYSGGQLEANKRDSIVNGVKVVNSGIVSHVLIADSFPSAQEVLDALYTVEEYVAAYPKLYFTARAVTLREGNKYESSRSLVVYYKGSLDSNGEIIYELVTENPLVYKSNDVAAQIIALRSDS